MDARPVRIYSAEDAPRLRYIAGIILGDILGLSWEMVTDKRKLGKHPVINYSDENIAGCFMISPDSLLFETGIRTRQISVGEWKGLPQFFQTNAGSDLPFDIFAASFFLITRYEEYLEFDPDQLGRFRASSSIACKNGFLGQPVIDLWAREFAKALLKKFQTLTFRRNEFRALLTIDTDQPFAYLGKNILSSIGGLFRDLTSGEGHPGDRYRIVVKGEKDPYEVFDYIIDSIEKYKADARFFFPVGDHSKFDKNPSWKNTEYRNLIHKISGKFKTGLHPSYNASRDSQLIIAEALRLKAVLERDIAISQFHSIRYFMPFSYTGLKNAGIIEDYSMGYPEEPGFRASIARPFCFYNVAEDQHTSLRIIPFQIMDSALCNNKKHDPLIAKEVILNLINETRKAGGTFVSIWHNTSLLDNTEGQGWREVFEFMLKTQTQ
jgi:hypothetical protein